MAKLPVVVSTPEAPWALTKPRELLSSLGKSWLDVLRAKSLPQEVIAGLTVAAVALPLNIALAVACDLPPSAGLIAGAVGGAVAAIMGGSALQVTGPAAALNVMVLSLNHNFGSAGVAASCIFIGLIQIALCALAGGRLIRYVPESVLAGFTTGVGLKLLDSQIPELLGFNYTTTELAQMMHRPAWLHEVSWLAVVCGLFVAFLVSASQRMKRFPAALVAIALITAVSNRLGWNIERVGLIPSTLPSPFFPIVADSQWLGLITDTIPLALLAAIESLISAQVIDHLAKVNKPYNSNLELFGQGLANIATGFVGGMPVSGVIVRSSVNVQSGAKTRLSALIHAVAMLFAILYLNETLATIPLSALAGLLCMVGARLIELQTITRLLREQRAEAACFLLTMIGTVTGHLMIGLSAGIALYFASQWLGKSNSELPKIVTPLQKVRPRSNHAYLATSLHPKRPTHFIPQDNALEWLQQIRERAQQATSAFIHHKASVIGKVVLGEHVHIAAESSVRADEGSPFYIGSNSNVQDGVVIHALKNRWIEVDGKKWAVYIGENVSIAHQALVHGPCVIGDHSFVGFQAVVHDSVVGRHCYIGIGAIVVGVKIPSGKFVPHGSIVDSQEAVDRLPAATSEHLHFNEEVVDVNRGLAAAYLHQSGVQQKLPIGKLSNRRIKSDRF